ncbi:NADH-quinone oxidoreductase subunit J [Actinotalea sp. BY-33]|uniref:NADH-quinone oxidoreductase subunit J n=1 Tax=Actinotalea soli TaxID=2819234 RepID=A0A939LSV9_9CELL|nr:NADH-quinone oxidoreductase subunit J [Actinotalea soli]MBO1752420.1 NADH-quinone oxidoreductase subunit J [Actinotalea soli]
MSASAVALGSLPAAPVLASLAETGRTSTGEEVLFWFIAPVMVLAALGLLFARKTVHAAMSVVLVMVCLAILYVAQEAPFLGVVQVIVYTGAVMMLFLFVLMLVGVDSSDSLVETIAGQRWVGVLLGLGLAGVLSGVVLTAADMTPVGLEAANADTNAVGVARIIFGDYVFALEVVGILLITAALGALVLTHRQRLTRRVGQKERADARVSAGTVLTPLPAPGVYARSNAMDVPALGPDGRPLDSSVPRVLRVRGQERAVSEVAAFQGPDAPHLTEAEESTGDADATGAAPPDRSITGEEPNR